MAATSISSDTPSTSRSEEGGQPTRIIHDKLLRQSFRRRREKGNVPYPVVYSPSQGAYDSWNQMFLATLRRDPSDYCITLHKFDRPPKRVLDLGCGSGYWVIEAATRYWKDTHFVGLDVLSLQPDVGRLDIIDTSYHFKERVRWVTANFLDPLPFMPDSFDFVRICGLGLAVPEDEWQNLLQEVRRVLEPGGVVEIIEEDLIFPASNMEKRPNSDLLNAHKYPAPPTISSSGSISDNSFSFSLSAALGDDDHHEPPPPYHASSRPSESNTIGPNSDTSSLLKSLHDDTDVLDPLDHTKLKNAWYNMLQRRFLAPRLTAVLPFYINSEFEDMQTHPPLHIVLPPNSERGVYANPTEAWTGSGSDTDLVDGLPRAPSVRFSRDAAEPDDMSTHSRRSTIVNQRAAMHLGRTVSLIEGCKEAIWEEYMIDARKKATEFKVEVARTAFEVAWTNWQNDMKDRMCMRGSVNKWLSWNLTDTERPEWRVWRDRIDPVESDTVSVSSGINPIDGELCRSLRSFIAWNILESPTSSDGLDDL